MDIKLTCAPFHSRFEDAAPPGGYDCVVNTISSDDYDARSLQVYDLCGGMLSWQGVIEANLHYKTKISQSERGLWQELDGV